MQKEYPEEYSGNGQDVRPKKKKKKKKKKRGIYLLRFVILIALGAGIFMLLSSEIFDIQKIKVENNEYYTARQIVHLAGANKGVNLFRADLSAMKDKLLADPYVKDAKVLRKLPNQIVIEIKERREYAVLPRSDDYVIIDEEQVVLQVAEDGSKLPQLTGLTVLAANPGEKIEVKEAKALDEIVRMLVATQKEKIYFNKIEYSPVVIKAYIYDSLFCEGTAGSIGDNVGALKKILYDLYSKGIERGVIRINAGGHYSFSPDME